MNVYIYGAASARGRLVLLQRPWPVITIPIIRPGEAYTHTNEKERVRHQALQMNPPSPHQLGGKQASGVPPRISTSSEPGDHPKHTKNYREAQQGLLLQLLASIVDHGGHLSWRILQACE